MSKLTAQEIHEIYNEVIRENDVLLVQDGMTAPPITRWEKLEPPRKELYEKMAELLNKKLAEEGK